MFHMKAQMLRLIIFQLVSKKKDFSIGVFQELQGT